MTFLPFARPALLLLLAVPAILAVWTWRRRSNRLALPFDHAEERDGRWLRRLVSSAETLPPLVLAVVILLLAGPQQLSEPKEKRILTNIEFCVDVSGSMTAPFGEGTRYDGSMQAIDQFLTYREGDAFGLTFFGNNVLHWVPLTSDVSALRCAPPFMRPEVVPPWFGGTMIGKALLACREKLAEREEGDRMIILVSDGDSFDLYGGADMEIAERLRRERIVVYAVHISETVVPDPIANITGLTGGEVFSPGDPAGLETVFRRIDAMQETRLEKVSADTMDFFFPYCATGLALVGLCVACSMGLRYTPW